MPGIEIDYFNFFFVNIWFFYFKIIYFFNVFDCFNVLMLKVKKLLFGSIIVIAFQNIFHSKMYINIIYIFKIIFDIIY